MSRNYDADDLDLDETEDVKETPLVKDLRRQIKELTKQNTTLAEENGTLKTSKRTSDLADVIKSKGLDPKVANLYPKDAEATPEALDAWLNEYGSVFGVKAQADEQQADEPSDEPTDLGLDPTLQRGYLRIAAAESGAHIPANRAAEIAARIRDAKTPEELSAALKGA